MTVYEFYWRDPIEGPQYIGALPERRKNPARITPESVMNWAKQILGGSIDFSDVFFITMTIDKDSDEILKFKE
jgi:hypothetical protein